MQPVMSESQSSSRSASRTVVVAQVVAYLLAVGFTVSVEISRFGNVPVEKNAVVRWMLGEGLDDETRYLLLMETSVSFPLLLVAPLVWCVRRRSFSGRKAIGWSAGKWFDSTSKPQADGSSSRLGQAWILALVVVFTSLFVSISIGSTRQTMGTVVKQFCDLPPAYHDEYSYLIQAKTFLAGRLWFPSHPDAPELFDQVHVLNEGKFASRYFPGSGAWMAPFVQWGKPYWGHWVAAMLTAMFFFWAGRELGGNGVGFLAGMLIACSPAIGIFSNLLLAHLPTLAGLSLFSFTFLRMLRTGRWGDALLAGVGLSFAMLCRPMTAAGFAFPFGVCFVGWLVRARTVEASKKSLFWLKMLGAMGGPLLVGMAMLLVTNKSITGNVWTTPYQVYTDTYTPRHVYGFNNRVRGEKRMGPKVLTNYDRWAENLTPALAIRNVRSRWLASWQWTMGVIPLAMGSIVFLILVPRTDGRWWLIPASILSLHAAHVPYWYDGIMHWHYVFETGPLWLLMFAGATGVLWKSWQASTHRLMPIWWSGFVGISLLTGYFSPGEDGLWPLSKTDAGIGNIAFSKKKYEEFHTFVEASIGPERALVLVEPDPSDRHIDFVVNDPDLSGDVLYGRFRPGETDLVEVVRLFADRRCFIYRRNPRRLERLGGQHQ